MIDRQDRREWLDGELAVLTAPETYDLHPDLAYTRVKMRVKKPIELAVLKEVAAWREREARQKNLPRGRVLKDDALQEIAQQQPRTEEALGRLRTIPRGYERSSAAREILAGVQRALAIPKAELPALPRPPALPEGTAAAVEFLKVLLKIVTEEEGVAAKILVSGDDLEKLAVHGEAAPIPALSGWRRDIFGKRALELLSGQSALVYRNRKVEIVPMPDA